MQREVSLLLYNSIIQLFYFFFLSVFVWESLYISRLSYWDRKVGTLIKLLNFGKCNSGKRFLFRRRKYIVFNC